MFSGSCVSNEKKDFPATGPQWYHVGGGKHMEDQILQKLDELISQQKETLKALKTLDKPLFVQDGDKKKILRISEICFITTNPKGLDIYTNRGEKFINFSSISQIEKDFSEDFRLMKTHKSFVVNLTMIDSVKVVPGGRELTFLGLPPDVVAKVTSESLNEFEDRLNGK
jgi:DNA-binding LytR/AlgR family response regulator